MVVVFLIGGRALGPLSTFDGLVRGKQSKDGWAIIQRSLKSLIWTYHDWAVHDIPAQIDARSGNRQATGHVQ